MVLDSTRKFMTKIIWYKDFGARFTKPVRQDTGSKSTGLVSPAWFKRKQFSRATYPTRSWNAYTALVHLCIVSLLHRLILPVVASASAEPVPAAGLPAVVPAVFHPHVATVHAAHMAHFAQAMCNPAQIA